MQLPETDASLPHPDLRWRRLIRYGIDSLVRPQAWQRYLRLRSAMHWSEQISTEPLECDDLFIVTSCTNPGDTEEAVNHNSAHSQWQRGEELLATFDSVRRHYPGAIIVNLENSKIASELAKRIHSKCDQQRDYSADAAVRESRTFANKGVPWLIKLLKFLHEEHSAIHATRIHLLCGRYLLTDNVLAKLSHPGSYLRYYPQYDNVSTRYIGYQRVGISEIREALRCVLRPMVFSRSAEDVIHLPGRFPKHYLSHIGVSGLVNGKDPIEE